ncbi:hypothetical protein EES44_24475 [Streptomyces sp. ADI96-15]|uniref:hypothetical protein n=1 Tax=Streptomyces sp. ADI96-15 TaxID=1522761 RepID=UPI000F54EEE5|nr:hypothetical protein [Streptomyces sp. ADI96-15]RPK58091.1 hypothetical protein EES44_24475 [Streptomyces sp. ADI96-15]
MDASTILNRLTSRANHAIEEDEAARTRLTKALAVDGAPLDGLMDAVLDSAGRAKPWRQLMKRIEKHGVREGLAKQREEATERLLQWGFSLSTSMVSNAQRIAEQDGLRRFLSTTDGMEISADEAPAEEVTAEPAPEPAPVEIPKATPAQKRTLAAIRDNGVKLQEFRIGRATVAVESGDRPRLDMVRWVISQGWAKADTSRSLFQGQPVALTTVGEAILAG